MLIACWLHVQSYSKNKFEKLVLLVGLITRRHALYILICGLSGCSTFCLALPHKITIFWKTLLNIKMCVLRLRTVQYILIYFQEQRVKCNILITEPVRCINISNLFWIRTLHVSDSLSVHHQESSTVHTAEPV
jgi:hypothetical protein